MSNYLKLFETTNEYTQYIEQGSPLLPNVSYTEDTLKVYYKPIIVPNELALLIPVLFSTPLL